MEATGTGEETKASQLKRKKLNPPYLQMAYAIDRKSMRRHKIATKLMKESSKAAGCKANIHEPAAIPHTRKEQAEGGVREAPAPP